MSRLGKVVKFEVLRTVRKKSFWFTTIVLPLFILVIYGVDYASSQHASQASQQQASAYSKTAKLAVDDETGLVNKQLLAQQHITIETNRQAGIAAVQGNKLTAFFYYPKNVSTVGIQVYAQTQGITFAPPYNAVALTLLRESAVTRANAVLHNPEITQILQKDPPVTATTYQDGKPTDGLAGLVVPGIFWILFMTLVVFLSSYTIASTTEEKENRAAEILLTSVEPRDFILGKIVSVLVVGLVQIVTISLPLVVAYILLRKHISLPGGLSL
ncbi:MAG TPA: ABC transporter permease, partial [Candidatus Acidoferrum sp.]|nr:ABC transporter permease [Candidatus Acidoferrum sp.]